MKQKDKRGERRIDLNDQILRFRSECLGPIFTCICCMRDLFQRSVVELKGDIEKKILNENQMHRYLNFDVSLKIKEEIKYRVKVRGKKEIIKTKKLQEGYSLCRTCIGYLNKSKMPPMCFQNSLQPAEIPDCLKNLKIRTLSFNLGLYYKVGTLGYNLSKSNEITNFSSSK